MRRLTWVLALFAAPTLAIADSQTDARRPATEAAQSDALNAPARALSTYVTEALDVIRVNSVYAKGVDWASIRARALQELGDSEDVARADALIVSTLRGLGDRHAFVRRRSAGAAGTASPPVASIVRANPTHDTLGYVSVVTSAPTSTAEANEYARRLRETINEQSPTASCGWVVDLRENQGGNMWPMLAGLQAILPRGTVGTFVTDRGARPWRNEDDGVYQGDTVVYALGANSRAGSALRPTAVLLGAKTASSGEAVAVALVSIPASRSFGAPTAGLATALAPHVFADGTVMRFSVAHYGDAKGNRTPETLQPDEPVAEMGATDAALSAARHWLLGQCKH